MLGLGLDLLFGWDCLACDEPLTAPALLCPICEVTLEPPRPPTQLGFPVFAGGAHTGALARAVHRLKYRDAAFVARPLGLWLATALPHHLAVDRVVPVPLHPRRLAERGYNQAALLARVVARERGLVSDPVALRRVTDTPTQTTLDREARADNVKGAFAARSDAPGRVLLVDDVVTTGATLLACAEAIRRGGGEVVGALVAATAL